MASCSGGAPSVFERMLRRWRVCLHGSCRLCCRLGSAASFMLLFQKRLDVTLQRVGREPR